MVAQKKDEEVLVVGVAVAKAVLQLSHQRCSWSSRRTIHIFLPGFTEAWHIVCVCQGAGAGGFSVS